jgi:hypothetical protein
LGRLFGGHAAPEAVVESGAVKSREITNVHFSDSFNGNVILCMWRKHHQLTAVTPTWAAETYSGRLDGPVGRGTGAVN